MKINNSLEILIEKIPRKGMSKKCQRFLPNIVRQYFEDVSLNELKHKLKDKNKGFADLIYRRLEQIKMGGLKKTALFSGKHPNDIKEGAVFAESIINYCMHAGKLEKELIKSSRKFKKESKINKDFLRKRYIDNEKETKDYHKLNSIAKEPEFYVFIIDNLLDKDY